MKNWKPVGYALLILASFSAGVGWNSAQKGVMAQGATKPGTSNPSDPQPALKSVAHNATLSGDGTDALPLSIANGGVGAAKLSTSATPSAGQVLGFNGANLAWQNAPVGGMRIVDNQGHIVGPFNPESNSVVRQINNRNYLLHVDANGFSEGSFSEYFLSANCSGPGMLNQWGYSSADFIWPTWGPAGVIGTRLYYGTQFTQQTIYSWRSYSPAAGGGNWLSCNSAGASGYGGFFAPEITFDLSTLNLTPPFHLEF